MKSKNLKILLTGGGTLGSVTPLIAVWQEISAKEKNAEVIFVGTKDGVEKDFVTKNYNLKYLGISSGKLRRYLSLQNLVDIKNIIHGYFEAKKLLKKQKPSCVVTAGSFVSVPLAIAAWRLGIPVFVHQLDIKIGLANRIMSWFAQKVTITFGDHLMSFSQKKTVLTGSPVRKELLSGDAKKAIKDLGLNKKLPTILILGGGIGAQKINELIERNLQELLKSYNIIHSTGKGKRGRLKSEDSKKGVYRVFEFINSELADYLSVSDLVVTRSGLATLAEIVAVHKPMIMIPIYRHQQEKNAFYFQKRGLGLVVEEKNNFDENFLNAVEDLMSNTKAQEQIAEIAKKTQNHVAAQVVAQTILDEIISK